MQYLIYSTEQNPVSTPPSPELMAEVGKFMEEAVKAGVVVTTEDSKQRARASGFQVGS